ncbi:nucleotidyltransferase family protein [Alteromonas sp. 1_MG-2023]|uniref:nucleotidyltransferase family protein n=1 Tax=Alteromonas sp. 1_MG-2023 TaxID=3062669 RepID=UPI0026E1990E|nr:nucleotidyltransferase family protein [Alteromonas sp. 1_MG-2023]MDO6569133.1 nucleotidyltransferase family protein [Alteromonas sp. 1_MG-2023]
MTKIASILLAGGESKRYGGNKLLSPHYSGLPLIHYSLQQVQGLHLSSIYVVTGRWHSGLFGVLQTFASQSTKNQIDVTQIKTTQNETILKETIHNKPTHQTTIQICHNDVWDEGIASSIRCGLNAVLESKDNQYTHVLVHLADLASVTTSTLDNLIEQVSVHPDDIIYSQWNNHRGELQATVPAIFPRAAFDSLLKLSGDKGAKKVIEDWKRKGKAVGVAHPESALDIDSPRDWKAYRSTGV